MLSFLTVHCFKYNYRIPFTSNDSGQPGCLVPWNKCKGVGYRRHSVSLSLFIEQSPSIYPDNGSAFKNIRHHLWKPKTHNVSISAATTPLHESYESSLYSHPLSLAFILILSSFLHLSLPTDPFRFSNCLSLCNSHQSRASCMLRHLSSIFGFGKPPVYW
jgi:hypothetical protein